MIIHHSLDGWRDYRRSLSTATLGFVPTMGALHAGHMSLVEQSQKDNEVTVVSIFVNPTQFNQPGDLTTYPRQLDQDLAMLRQCKVDALFMPDYQALYPDEYLYKVKESVLSQRFCGAHRPGHFDGVLTVVMKLLNIVQPRNAYFGEKDYQQMLLIRGMTEAFFMPVNILACPVVREADGLAMSSRNQRLDAEQRQQASGLYRALKNSESPQQARLELERAGFTVDYVEDFLGRRLAAASLGATRLIDNVPIE